MISLYSYNPIIFWGPQRTQMTFSPDRVLSMNVNYLAEVKIHFTL